MKKARKKETDKVVGNFGFVMALKRQKMDGQQGLKRNNY